MLWIHSSTIILWNKELTFVANKVANLFVESHISSFESLQLGNQVLYRTRYYLPVPNQPSSYTKIWFINGVDNVNWPPYRDWKADVSSVSPSSERRANAQLRMHEIMCIGDINIMWNATFIKNWIKVLTLSFNIGGESPLSLQWSWGSQSNCKWRDMGF